MVVKDFHGWLESLDFQLTQSEPYTRLFPGLPTAFDAEAMREILTGIFFPGPEAASILNGCEPGKGNFETDGHCRMQYECSIEDRHTGEAHVLLINTLLFSDPVICRAFYESNLLPLAGQAAGRTEFHGAAQPVALVEPLCMTLSIFPIDGEMPTLCTATDRGKLKDLLCPLLPEAKSGEAAIHDIRLELAHYGRHKRCVLRYLVEVEDHATHSPRTRTVYGKVDAEDQGELTAAVVKPLQQILDRPNVHDPFRIPETYGYLPELKMLLMNALPGEPVVKQLIKQFIKGTPAEDAEITLEEAMVVCSRILATFHTSGIEIGQKRTFDFEIESLGKDVAVVQRVYPELGRQLRAWLEQIQRVGQSQPAMALCFSHGDFTYAQLIFAGKEAGLVDFDTACQAEPALDLGQFLSYQWSTFQRSDAASSPHQVEEIEMLSRIFLETYFAKAGVPEEERAAVRSRVAVYEATSLLHLALHSWQKFKGSRLKHTLAIIEEQIARLQP